MHRNKETVCLLHSQFFLFAHVHLPTRVCCKNPKVPIAKFLLEPILLHVHQIIMVTIDFLLLLKIIILSNFINFSSTIWEAPFVLACHPPFDIHGHDHHQKWSYTFLHQNDHMGKFFLMWWGQKPSNKIWWVVTRRQNFMGIFPQKYGNHVNLHTQTKFQYY
jgi:hypothetical protein